MPTIELGPQTCPWPKLTQRWLRTLQGIRRGELRHLKANNATLRLATEALKIDTVSSMSVRLTPPLAEADFTAFAAAVQHSHLNAIRVVWASDSDLEMDDSGSEPFMPSDDEEKEPASDQPLQLIDAVRRNDRIRVVALELDGSPPHPEVLNCLRDLNGREIHLSLGTHRGPWSAHRLPDALRSLTTNGSPVLRCLSLVVGDVDHASTGWLGELQQLPSVELAELNLCFSSIPSRKLALQLLVHFIQNHQLHTLVLKGAPSTHPSKAFLSGGEMQAILLALERNTTLTTLQIDISCSKEGLFKPTDTGKIALARLLGRNLVALHHRNLDTPREPRASASKRRRIARHHQLPIWSQDRAITMLYTSRLQDLWSAVGRSQALERQLPENDQARQQYISEVIAWKATRLQREMKSKLGHTPAAQVDEQLAALRQAAGVEPGYHVTGKPAREFEFD
ncbi:MULTISPECIES: hypothetical protein [unclassified Rhizobacter]|uniref:hypothetical protein n=1 Tax=unclassified Rhizobacter TaxID=2640088 RepID=UPI000B225231|nr:MULTISPECIES: hypothetical protein [unclassified Rhizobacter]